MSVSSEIVWNAEQDQLKDDLAIFQEQIVRLLEALKKLALRATVF